MARKRKRARIVVVGSANVDLTTFTDRMPRPGETIFGSRFDLGFGGKGANQAVAASLCGARVHMVARVGVDLFGPATIENLEKRRRHARGKDGEGCGERSRSDLRRLERSEPHPGRQGSERFPHPKQSRGRRLF